MLCTCIHVMYTCGNRYLYLYIYVYIAYCSLPTVISCCLLTITCCLLLCAQAHFQKDSTSVQLPSSVSSWLLAPSAPPRLRTQPGNRHHIHMYIRACVYTNKCIIQYMRLLNICKYAYMCGKANMRPDGWLGGQASFRLFLCETSENVVEVVFLVLGETLIPKCVH